MFRKIPKRSQPFMVVCHECNFVARYCTLCNFTYQIARVVVYVVNCIVSSFKCTVIFKLIRSKSIE